MCLDLKPCPKCFSTNVNITTGSWTYVQCLDCGTQTSRYLSGDVTFNYVADDWNTRKDSDEVMQLRNENESLKRLAGVVICNEEGHTLDWEIDEGVVIVHDIFNQHENGESNV
ncbi:TPA: Lar family restriction alleviation protein [Vibrio parahaemolyticus]|nr:Lar family restriction alleviation protein [Vibrio parahaemolyticus]